MSSGAVDNLTAVDYKKSEKIEFEKNWTKIFFGWIKIDHRSNFDQVIQVAGRLTSKNQSFWIEVPATLNFEFFGNSFTTWYPNPKMAHRKIPKKFSFFDGFGQYSPFQISLSIGIFKCLKKIHFDHLHVKNGAQASMHFKNIIMLVFI